MSDTYYHDYDNEPIGGGNPYWRCVHCKRSDPEINGRLEGHDPDCEYRLKKEAELRMSTPGNPVADALALADAGENAQAWAAAAAQMAQHREGSEDASDTALRILAAEVRRQTQDN